MNTLFTFHRYRGFSLIELMVALTLGLLVTLAISSLFISANTSYKQNDATSKMQENARFALELISQDLRHAGFLGNVSDSMDVNVDTIAVAVPSVDCGTKTSTNKAGLYNFTATRFVINYGYQMTTLTPYGTCLGITPKSNSNILLVKRTAADTTPTADLQNKHVYVYGNGLSGRLLTYPAVPALDISNGEYWEYQPRIYYVVDEDINSNGLLDGSEDLNANGILDSNVLYRETMDYSGATPTLRAEPVASGIEIFHVEFGIDSDHNGTPDYYYVPPANTDPFAATNTAMNEAISATAYLLARTSEPDRGHTDDRKYKLGSMAAVGPFNDQYHRRVYSTTVTLKNLRPQVKNR